MDEEENVEGVLVFYDLVDSVVSVVVLAELEKLGDVRSGLSESDLTLVLENREPRESQIDERLELVGFESPTKQSVQLLPHFSLNELLLQRGRERERGSVYVIFSFEWEVIRGKMRRRVTTYEYDDFLATKFSLVGKKRHK